jgi:hypothetical protein
MCVANHVCVRVCIYVCTYSRMYACALCMRVCTYVLRVIIYLSVSESESICVPRMHAYPHALSHTRTHTHLVHLQTQAWMLQLQACMYIRYDFVCPFAASDFAAAPLNLHLCSVFLPLCCSIPLCSLQYVAVVAPAFPQLRGGSGEAYFVCTT